MHHPVHPHSQDPGRTADREGGQPTAGAAPEARETPERGGDPALSAPVTGPFSGSAEKGYRPASRVNVPNPYTTRRLNVDEVDTGVAPVGQWRGVGLNEPEPRPPHIPATTDTMTDTPSPTEHTERPEAPVSQTQAPVDPEPQRSEPPLPEPSGSKARGSKPRVSAQQGQGAFPQDGEARQQPEPPSQQAPGWTEPEPQHAPQGQPPAAPPSPQGQPGHGRQPGAGYDPAAHEQYAPPRYGHPYRQAPGSQYSNPYEPRHTEQGPYPAQDPYAAQGPYPAQDPYAAQGPYTGQPYPQAPTAHPAPRTEGYQPQTAPPHHGGYAPHHPQGQPVPYPPHHTPYPTPYPQQPLVTYQNAYPAPFQPPGYVVHGQPIFYPGQFNPYGQPVQHVIVLTPGQQPQVITAESASTLFTELAESAAPAVSEDVRGDRALTRAGPEEEAASADAPRPEAEAPAEAEDEAASEAPAEAAPKAVPAEAVEPDLARSGDESFLSEALAGLAMRDLSLVDALLEMVEELETDAQDPDLLDKLFQIDNFATRMRRNGENFLVLTGHDGGESDAHDEIVPLLDVARAATSEIKDYPRVRLGKIPQTSITGMAADDISHLLAELLDNATANSPEHSQVVISAQEMDDGRLMIVVEDEGVGIPEAQLVQLNRRLGGEPGLEDDVPRHMGLYVASRIAEKHGLETRLESRSFRGVSAYAIIPKELMRVATPRTPGQTRMSTVPSPMAPMAPISPTGPVPSRSAPTPGANGSSAKPPTSGGSSVVTAAGLPRRSATPHGSPLRMMPRPGQTQDNPPKGREDTPPKLTGEARAEQIRDELGDFLDGERAALEDSDGAEDDQK